MVALVVISSTPLLIFRCRMNSIDAYQSALIDDKANCCRLCSMLFAFQHRHTEGNESDVAEEARGQQKRGQREGEKA